METDDGKRHLGRPQSSDAGAHGQGREGGGDRVERQRSCETLLGEHDRPRARIRVFVAVVRLDASTTGDTKLVCPAL